jgi:hypothetical protein
LIVAITSNKEEDKATSSQDNEALAKLPRSFVLQKEQIK